MVPGLPGHRPARHDRCRSTSSATACATPSTPDSSGCRGRGWSASSIRRIALGILVMLMVTVLVFGIFFAGGRPADGGPPTGRPERHPTDGQHGQGSGLHLDQPIVTAVLGLPQAAGLAPQPGLLVLPPAAGLDRPQAGLPDHPVPGPRRGGHLAGARHPVRGPLGRAAGDDPGPRHHDARPVLLLDADVRPGPAAAVSWSPTSCTNRGIRIFPGPGVHSTSPRARSSGSRAWSCRGSRWPWCRRRPTPG